MFLLVDKGKGMTSHDVVDRIRKITGEKKVGHAGTLDPNATGLLIVGVKKDATKRLSEISGKNKTYVAELFLGEERDTDDVEGKTVSKKERNKTLLIKEIRKALGSFRGEIEQVPPVYSAIKIQGRKAYELARKNKKVVLKARKIRVESIKILKYEFPVLELRLEVSKGTYIRSIARDLGRKLGIGAYLKNLRREKINGFDLKDAVKLEDLNQENYKKYLVNI